MLLQCRLNSPFRFTSSLTPSPAKHNTSAANAIAIMMMVVPISPIMMIDVPIVPITTRKALASVSASFAPQAGLEPATP